MGEPIRVLAVCTANICRSPVAERLLAHHLTHAGVACVVRSAGTHADQVAAQAVPDDTLAAAAAYGLDLRDHRPRQLTRELLDTDGADLVITMSREHLYEAVSLDRDAFTRTFTLPELARRAARPIPGATDVAGWLDSLADGRTAASLLPGSPDDDVADPFGGPKRGHDAMVAVVDQHVRDIARAVSRVFGSRPR